MAYSKDTQDFIKTLQDFDPNRLTSEVISTGEEWADHDAAASALEETKKTVLARLALEHISGSYLSVKLGEKPKAMSAVQAELNALADPRYELHLELMVQARKESNRARVRYDLGRMRLELMRSLQATMRNEMRISGQAT